LAYTLLQMHLACVELCVLAAAVPLVAVLPGVVFTVWMAGCAAYVAGVCWVLNGGKRGQRGAMYQCEAESKEWMAMGQEGEDEKWLFVGGMGAG
jgi:hypothetical protein